MRRTEYAPSAQLKGTLLHDPHVKSQDLFTSNFLKNAYFLRKFQTIFMRKNFVSRPPLGLNHQWHGNFFEQEGGRGRKYKIYISFFSKMANHLHQLVISMGAVCLHIL